MKITAVRTHVLEARLSQPFAYSRAWYDTRTAMIVEIATDDGLTGWGECYGPARMTAAVVASVAPWLIGADPLAHRRRCGARSTRGCAITGRRASSSRA